MAFGLGLRQSDMSGIDACAHHHFYAVVVERFPSLGVVEGEGLIHFRGLVDEGEGPRAV